MKVREDFLVARLSSADVTKERCAVLSSPQRCIEILQQGDTAWDVLVALCMHINGDLDDRQTSGVDWQAEVSGPVFDAIAETEFSRPTFVGEYGHHEVPFDADVSRHIHSRVAASLLTQGNQPELALQYLELANQILPPTTLVRLPRDLSWDFGERVRRPLQQLYERSGHYELALQLHRLRGRWGSPEQHYVVTEAYLDRWTAGLKDGATVREAKTLLDTIYSVLVDSDRVDEEIRDSLADCPRDTHQFWAWFYGRTAGLLKIEHPYLKDALLHELDASDWVDGWAAASILIEEHPEWMALRKVCMNLYWASDIEYKGARPWNARQPAHLSPSSDLYWAMRVGYCDAHIETGRGSAELSTAELGEQIEKLEQIVSSGGLRAIRSHQEVMQGITSMTRAIPTEETARDSLKGDVGEVMLDSLPSAIVEHLVTAWLARQQGRPNDARVAAVKAIEAVFTRLIKRRLQEVARRVQVRVTRPNGTHWSCSLERIGHIQLAEWAALLPDLVRGQGGNARLHDALFRGFPSIDWEMLGRCEPGLRDASNARGQAAHDADRESYDDAVMEADRLWSIAVGSPETPGLISKLCAALDGSQTQ